MAKPIPIGPIIAVALVVGVGAWLMTGEEPTSQPIEEESSTSAPERLILSSVQVKNLEHQPIKQVVEIDGITKAFRTIAIASETNGTVVELLKDKGDTVIANELIARIDAQDLPAKLRQARAYVEQTRLEYEAASRLGDQGLQNRVQLAANLTRYEQAQAELDSLQRALSKTEIRAPFGGIIESRAIEQGSFVSPGQAVAELYDFTPLLVEGDISENDVSLLALGQPVSVSLVTGQQLEGVISYIGGVANSATRTFKVEISIADSGLMLAGVTAAADVELPETMAHYVSPALLNINDQGDVGLKTLDADNRVVFVPVDIVRSDTGGVWVTGLTNPAAVIVVGQGFVSEGEVVEAFVATESNSQGSSND